MVVLDCQFGAAVKQHAWANGRPPVPKPQMSPKVRETGGNGGNRGETRGKTGGNGGETGGNGRKRGGNGGKLGGGWEDMGGRDYIAHFVP